MDANQIFLHVSKSFLENKEIEPNGGRKGRKALEMREGLLLNRSLFELQSIHFSQAGLRQLIHEFDQPWIFIGG